LFVIIIDAIFIIRTKIILVPWVHKKLSEHFTMNRKLWQRQLRHLYVFTLWRQFFTDIVRKKWLTLF